MLVTSISTALLTQTQIPLDAYIIDFAVLEDRVLVIELNPSYIGAAHIRSFERYELRHGVCSQARARCSSAGRMRRTPLHLPHPTSLRFATCVSPWTRLAARSVGQLITEWTLLIRMRCLLEPHSPKRRYLTLISTAFHRWVFTLTMYCTHELCCGSFRSIRLLLTSARRRSSPSCCLS